MDLLISMMHVPVSGSGTDFALSFIDLTTGTRLVVSLSLATAVD